MPATAADARDLLVASVLCDDPVIYIDDRWLYEELADIGPVSSLRLEEIRPQILREGGDVTLVGASHATILCRQAAEQLARDSIDAEVVDLRVVAPLEIDAVVRSVRKTGRLCAVDGSWANCGLAGEVIASVVERLDPGDLRAAPCRVTLPPASAPTSRPLEAIYYPTGATVVAAVQAMMRTKIP